MLTSVLMSFGQRAAYSGRMFLIGMGTVFAVLALLWGALVLFRRATNRPQKQERVEEEPHIPPTPRAFVAPALAQQQDDALIAVITAAVAAAMSEEQGGQVPSFRVVAFRRVGK